MTPEEIDVALAQVMIPANFTCADGLTKVFGEDWNLRRDITRGVADTVTIRIIFQMSVPMEVAKAHLRRLTEIELRGEPGNHELFKKP